MLQVNAAVQSLRFSVIRQMGLRARNYADVISLGIGEPDMHTAPHVCNAAHADVCAGFTHYAPSQGDGELLQALVCELRGRGYPAAEEGLIVTHGAMHGLACAMRAALEPGDEVLVPAPHFPDYRAHVLFAGGVLREIPTSFEQGFLPRPEDVEAAITPRTRVLLLNSPCNPTGAVLPPQLLDALAELAVRRNLLVFSDEVYDRICFAGPCESIVTRPGLAERTVVFNSFSKAYAMTGWRVGFALGPRWFMEQMIKVVSFTMASVNTPGQRAALAALRGDQAPFLALAEEFRRRSAYVYERLAAMPGIRVHKPAGSFYLFPEVAALDPDGERFALELLDQEQVVVIPGFTFGAGGQGCVRLACTVPLERLERAMDRMARFVARHPGPGARQAGAA